MSEMAYFNIGEQNADRIYNVVGDVYEGRTIVSDLRRGVQRADLSAPTARRARAHLDDIDAAFRDGHPDPPRIARALEKLTRLLSATGTLVAAGAGLVDPITALALWLGDLGKSALQELGKP